MYSINSPVVRRLIPAILVVSSLSLGVVTLAFGSGHESNNGGDARASEFVQIGNTLLNEISGLPVDEQKPIDLSSLGQALREVKVKSVNGTLYTNDGDPVDAVNYPGSMSIQFCKQCWDKMSETLKRNLVLHEYLGILGLNDYTYSISSKILAEIPDAPTGVPTGYPTGVPTGYPTGVPTGYPTGFPTGVPTGYPTGVPTGYPTGVPTGFPTGVPTGYPTGVPSPMPSGV